MRWGWTNSSRASELSYSVKDLWAKAVAAGIPDELFWRCDIEELVLLLRAIHERDAAIERAANMRAGLIAAVIVNTNPYRKRGAPTVKPADFFREPTVDRMTIEEAQMFMRTLARRN